MKAARANGKASAECIREHSHFEVPRFKTKHGKTCCGVDFAAASKMAGALTQVPVSVGLIKISCLLAIKMRLVVEQIGSLALKASTLN